MTTTASTGSTASKPVEHAHKPQQDKARGEADKTGQASDLFAGLLALMSDAAPLAPSDELQDATQTDTDPQALDPLASMLAWMSPPKAGAAEADATARPRTAPNGPAATGVDAPRREGIDIDGMTRVDEAAPALPSAADKARAAAASRPAFSPLNPAAPANAVASASSTRASDAAGGGAGAHLVWQRAGLGTDALQPQNAASLAQVRSTVALNERFGLAGVPPELAAATATSARDANAAPTGPGAVTGAATATSFTGDTSTAGLLGAGAGGDAGNGSSSDTGNSAPGGDGQPQPHAEAGREAEATTVSHWGTQHLRHASLRVGGEGSADAIDIQLQVKGQEVQVNFQTDNAEARAHLRESAGESLADLMQRGGIQLGNVSVGSQGPSQGDSSHAQPTTAQRSQGSERRAAAQQDVARAPVAPTRTDGSRPLDVFA